MFLKLLKVFGSKNWVKVFTDMEKDNLFTQQRFDPKLFSLKKCVNLKKSELTTKQLKIFLTTSMNKTGLPHIYRGKNYVVYLICSSFLK